MKLLRFLLIVSLFILVLAIMSNSFDFDFGWHLRFGDVFWKTGRIPYLDTATWTHAGQLWVNHEWGGDVLMARLYALFGYRSLVVTMSAILVAAFLSIHRAFKRRLTTTALIASLVSMWFVEQTIVMRLAMFTPLFLVATIAILERAGSKKFFS